MNEETKGLPVVARIYDAPKLISDQSPNFGNGFRVVVESEHLEALFYRDAELAELREQNECLRMQLVACGVVALANTPDSAAKARDMNPDYWSASCGDVVRAVDAEIAIRAERDALQAELAAMRDQKPVAWIREPDADGMALDWYPGNLAGLPIGTKLYAGPVSAPSQVAAEVVQTNREKARDAVAAVLGDAMDCTRAWSAWRVGTMSERDFSVIAEDEDRLYEIVDAALLATSQGEA